VQHSEEEESLREGEEEAERGLIRVVLEPEDDKDLGHWGTGQSNDGRFPRNKTSKERDPRHGRGHSKHSHPSSHRADESEDQIGGDDDGSRDGAGADDFDQDRDDDRMEHVTYQISSAAAAMSGRGKDDRYSAESGQRD